MKISYCLLADLACRFIHRYRRDCIFHKKNKYKILIGGFGFSAGVMVYISFVEIFAEASQTLKAELGNTRFLDYNYRILLAYF